jgi:hypothetical protein
MTHEKKEKRGVSGRGGSNTHDNIKEGDAASMHRVVVAVRSSTLLVSSVLFRNSRRCHAHVRFVGSDPWQGIYPRNSVAPPEQADAIATIVHLVPRSASARTMAAICTVTRGASFPKKPFAFNKAKKRNGGERSEDILPPVHPHGRLLQAFPTAFIHPVGAGGIAGLAAVTTATALSAKVNIAFIPNVMFLATKKLLWNVLYFIVLIK